MSIPLLALLAASHLQPVSTRSDKDRGGVAFEVGVAFGVAVAFEVAFGVGVAVGDPSPKKTSGCLPRAV